MPLHGFGYAVLDLQARVDLEEVEASRVCGVDDELDRAGRAIAAPRARGAPRPRTAPRAADALRPGRRGFLDDLLVAPLHRAVALAERDDLALAVAEDLHLDVARTRYVLLQEHAAVAESCCRRAARRCRRRARSSASSAHCCMPMPPPPAVLLSITGIADALRFAQRLSQIAQQSAAGQQRQRVVRCQRARGVFQPEVAHLLPASARRRRARRARRLRANCAFSLRKP